MYFFAFGPEKLSKPQFRKLLENSARNHNNNDLQCGPSRHLTSAADSTRTYNSRPRNFSMTYSQRVLISTSSKCTSSATFVTPFPNMDRLPNIRWRYVKFHISLWKLHIVVLIISMWYRKFSKPTPTNTVFEYCPLERRHRRLPGRYLQSLTPDATSYIHTPQFSPL